MFIFLQMFRIRITRQFELARSDFPFACMNAKISDTLKHKNLALSIQIQ